MAAHTQGRVDRMYSMVLNLENELDFIILKVLIPLWWLMPFNPGTQRQKDLKCEVYSMSSHLHITKVNVTQG